jgi:quinol monooxygenase YgiN
MIIVTGQVRFGPGEVARLRPAFDASITSSRAEWGCLSYDYGVDIEDPDRILIVETWSDQAALDAHAARVPELMAPLAGADIRQISIKAYQADYLSTLVGD